MNFNEYQRACLRTWNTDPTGYQQILNATLGLTGESGEFAETVKKWAFHGHGPPDSSELGDVLYYLAILTSKLGATLEGIAVQNIRKLEERYPDGFDSEKSRNRKG